MLKNTEILAMNFLQCTCENANIYFLNELVDHECNVICLA